MPSFCANCGSPLNGNSAFCPQCGKPTGSQAGAPTYYPPMTPAAVAPKRSSALTIVIVVLCCLAVGAAVVIGGVVYVAHRVKQAVVQKAAENGVDLHALVNSANSHDAVAHSVPKACSLLTKEEASTLIGEPIERAESKDNMCAYYGPPGLSAKLRDQLGSSSMKRAQTPGADPSALNTDSSLEQIVNSLGAKSGLDGNEGEQPMLMLGVDADGKAQMTAVNAGKAIFSGIVKASDGKVGFGADIPGLGDQAIRLPKLGLNVLQGDTMIRVIPGPFPGSDAKTIAIARAVMAKL